MAMATIGAGLTRNMSGMTTAITTAWCASEHHRGPSGWRSSAVLHVEEGEALGGVKEIQTPDLLVAKAPPARPVGIRQRLARCMRCVATHRCSRRGHTGGTGSPLC